MFLLLAIINDDQGYEQESHALYAMLSTYLTDELTLNTGVRYNYIDNKAGSSLTKNYLVSKGTTNSGKAKSCI